MDRMPPDENPGPEDPISLLAEGAAQLHELFTAYVNAGFSRAEALQITVGIITAQPRPPQ